MTHHVQIIACLMIQFSPIEVPSNILIHSSPGTGAVYSFDPVGSYERETCRAAGAAQSLVQPFLDNQVSSRFIQTYGRSNQGVYTNRRVSSFSEVNQTISDPFLILCTVYIPLTYLFTDLLQKSDARPWNILFKTPAIIHCAVPRDRFFYWRN